MHAMYSIHKKTENTSSFSLYHFSGTKTEKVHRQESLADRKKRDIIFCIQKTCSLTQKSCGGSRERNIQSGPFL